MSFTHLFSWMIFYVFNKIQQPFMIKKNPKKIVIGGYLLNMITHHTHTHTHTRIQHTHTYTPYTHIIHRYIHTIHKYISHIHNTHTYILLVYLLHIFRLKKNYKGLWQVLISISIFSFLRNCIHFPSRIQGSLSICQVIFPC